MHSVFGALCLCAAVAGPALAVQDKRAANISSPLKFKEDGTFHINVFEDLHFGDRKSTENKTVCVRGH
jgi:hypothetical protein